jgi:cytochrome c-type biogenesis protein CcmH/NrfF
MSNKLTPAALDELEQVAFMLKGIALDLSSRGDTERAKACMRAFELMGDAKTDLFAAARRVEKLEGERILLTKNQQWGMQLLEKLGEFANEALKAPTPMTTQIMARVGDADLPVLHLWATTSDQDPAARCRELAEQLRLAKADGEAMRDAQADIAEAACNAAEQALSHYRCHRTIIEGDGDGMPLVDKLTTPGASDISSGQEELEMLIDAVGGAILGAIPGSAQAVTERRQENQRLTGEVERLREVAEKQRLLLRECDSELSAIAANRPADKLACKEMVTEIRQLVAALAGKE